MTNNSDHDDHVYDVIVIGAGISGLSGAKLLINNGVDVLMLEAKNRVGGRTLTIKNSKVNWADLGGAYVGRTQNHLLRIIKELGLKLYPVNEVENLVYYSDYTHIRALFHYDQFPWVDLLSLLDFNHVTRLIDKMGEQIPAAEPWKAPKAQQWDKKTIKEFLEENTITKGSRELWRIIIQNIVANEPYESSLLWFLWYVKQCHGTKSITATTNGAQEFKVSGGTNQISERLAELVGKERVLLEHPVYYVEQKADEEHVLIRTVDGKRFKSRFLIMATAPAVQQKIHYQPALPPIRNQLVQRAPMGSTLKCVVYYETRFWKPKDMCGSLIIIGDDYRFPVPVTFDDTKDDGTHPAIIGFMPADKAHKVVSLSKEDRLRIICDSFAKAFNCEEARKPIHYEEYNWMEDQYCGGGYTMTCAPGFLTRFGQHLHEPVGRLYFAGTECASEWSGYMNGAIQSGERAARQVLVELGRLTPDQVYQSEPDSLEYPPVKYIPDVFERWAPSAKRFLHCIALGSIAALSLVAGAYMDPLKVGFRIALPFRM